MALPLVAARLIGAGILDAAEIAAARIAAGSPTGEEAKVAYALRYGDRGEETPELPEDITIPVSSSAIRAIGWRKEGVIVVEFNARGTYTYDGDYQLFQAFLAAPSKGGFFNAYFK